MPIYMRKNGLKVQNSDGTWVSAGGVASTATEEDVIKNKNDIASMQNETSGILAQAKEYMDNKDDIVSANFDAYFNKDGVINTTANADELPYGFACLDASNPTNPNTFHSTLVTMGLNTNPNYRTQMAFPWMMDDQANLPRIRIENNGVWGNWLNILTDDRADKRYANCEYINFVNLGDAETNANDLKEISPGIFGYKCIHWKNYPSEHIDTQGTIIDISYGTSGENHWGAQYFISPHTSDVWKRNFWSTTTTEWEHITHHFWSGTTTAKSNTLNFKPSMVMVFSGDFVSATNASNGFITITNTGFDFASAPDKAYGVYAFA